MAHQFNGISSDHRILSRSPAATTCFRVRILPALFGVLGTWLRLIV
jgi:hypothetical protein